jgi:nitrous-oxide reductase
MRSRARVISWTAVAAIAALMVVASRCAPKEPQAKRASGSDAATAAQKTYVAPGDLDEYYMFASGGHSGQVFVFGLPSMRHLVTIPVFSPYPATGYGFDDESKLMLGKDFTWGDDHHPALSETNGDYDGRWLFINEMNGRIARIDLRDFKTKQILWRTCPAITGRRLSRPTPSTR